uniref:Secernin-2 n=1 Tax=Romanomermis culicivorax TaxID=13658 RepID=A0A915HH66_ROMCU
IFGCDTFVILPPLTKNGVVIFGKNSDRPSVEIQEVIYQNAQNHSANTKIKCTYIEIAQTAHTNAVILSKPSWMWGAEMGANEHGVVVGNEAVWTKCGEEKVEMLTGMDLVRLGLERSNTAEACVDTIASLLETCGQGGACSEDIPDLCYNSSFLIADGKEAWVLETAGKEWAANKISGIDGYRNISNVLTIGTKIDKMSKNLKDFAVKNGWWNGQEPFNFAKIYGVDDSGFARLKNGAKLIAEKAKNKSFSITDMISVLRDQSSGICMPKSQDFATTGSQVSVLAHKNNNVKAIHFFTGTVDASISSFKPFSFPKVTSDNFLLSTHIKSPIFNDDPAKMEQRFQTKVDRRHTLYKFHELSFEGKHPKNRSIDKIKSDIDQMEKSCISDIESSLINDQDIPEPELLFNEAIEAELKIYKY